jgi:hypothetical protein
VTCAASMSFSTPRCSHSIPVVFLLLMAARAIATVEISKAKPSPCSLPDDEAAGLEGDANYSKTMYALFKAGRFEQLDCLADSVRSQKEMFPGFSAVPHVELRLLLGFLGSQESAAAPEGNLVTETRFG